MSKNYHVKGLLLLLFTIIQSSYGQSVMHYWNFNNNASVAAITTPSQTIGGAALNAIPGGISIIDATGGTGQNFNLLNINAQNGDPSGTHLRFNDPIGGALEFALPTTGYENVVVKFATRRSAQGAGTQSWSYSINGTTYAPFTTVLPNNGDPSLATLDFSVITAVDNNPNFKLKVEFSQAPGGTGGNNRFDNFTAEGTTLGGGSDTTAPIATFLPINGASNVNAATNPTIAFNESVRLLDNSAISNTNIDAVVELRLNNASGALVPFDATFASNTITINPTSNLANNQLYYVALLPNTVEDSSDNAITTTQSASFTTSNPSTSSIDLSTYVRVARYNLPEPLTTSAPTNNLLCQEASAVAYNWDTDTLFITADGSTSVTQVSKTGQLIDTMTMALGSSPQGTDFYDTEGITYIGGGQFVMSEERDRQLVKFTYTAGTTLTRANTQTVKIGTFVSNTGTEGLCYDPLTGGFICLKEIDPIGIFQTNVDFAAGTATNGSATTVNSVNLFDPALLGFTDVADVFVLANLPTQSTSSNLLVLSQENAQVVNIDRNGNIASTLTIVADPGDILSVSAQQHEGITMDNDGIIYIVNENGGGDINHPQLWVYAPSNGTNLAPTGIALTNTVPAIIENSITTPAVRVADIIVTDDGLGTNTYSLSGVDANDFQITASSLFIKPGTVLDFETKSTYNVTVNVDDATVGATPDASVNFVLSVTDLVNETPQLPAVTVSEVAPWGSGNSPAAADWFEVTNNGPTALNITGWKVDDSSNSFAASLALTGITSIAPGESVIFLESSASNPAATVIANFKSLWFGANPPASLQVGTYQGSGIGLSTGGDAVNLYDAAGTLQANVVFGASPTTLFKSFNNAVGLTNTTITQLSEIGINDAFAAINDANEIGSPGSVGRLFVSEVAPWSSGNSPVGADWFEVTNTRAVAVDITGWKVDDSSQSPAAALPLNGITSIAPGESVIFIETNNLAGATTAFLNNWFGTNPTGSLRIGNYTGSGIGLSTGGDQVNLYNSGNVLQTSVVFGTSPTTTFATFDNKVGINSLVTPITQLSVVAVNGAFIAANSPTEIGSPGTIITTPCPTLIATATPASATVCAGSTTTITVTTTGGTLPYVVSGSPLTVGAGTYNYTITDAKGCTTTATATVTNLPTVSVNLSVTTTTTSETEGTIVTVTTTASEPVCADQTVSLDVTGTGITASDYNLSATTITIPSGSTSGSVTFTVLNDNVVEPTETAVLTISNPSAGIVLEGISVQNITINDFVFTLQVLHASDFEAAVDAVADAPRFAAIVDTLEETYANTIKLSSGDNYIPGPFLSSGEDSSLLAAFKTAYESYYNTTFTASTVNLLPSIGRADISIMNFIGIEASALGNHEFDLGTTEVRNIIRGANSSATTRTWFGSQFPYLSANLNFSGDSNLSAIATTNRLLPNTTFQSNPTEAVTAITNKLKLAPSTVIIKGGQKIGVVGATTQVLASISSPGATTVIGGGANDMDILAGILQPVVNSLIADGCNKIIVLSHLQQIAFEKELAGKLTGVDIIIAGGSNTLMADANDRLRTGDVAVETYPFLATGLDGNALAVINTEGNYKYVGRLVVDFDSNGTLIPSSINSLISGVYATDEQGLNDAWGANVTNAFAPGTKGYQVQLLCTAIGNVITVKDGNLFGKTSVFLEGRRNFVRTEETNLGNLSAEANLWLAKFYDPTTVISIKNGGGIRSAIGNVIAIGDNVTLVPPIANPSAGKQSGDISQLDIENSLRFNNQLSLVTLTASGMRSILENAVAGTTATATPGQFGQVAGVRYSYNFSLPVGSRILNAVVTDSNGNAIDTLVVNGTTVGDLSRTFRVVTLNFLAGGGDGYPFNTLSTNRIDLNTLPEQGPAAASFTNPGSEQDAFAEYMKNQFSTTPYGIAETPLVGDCRVQRVPARTDDVLPLSAGINGTLAICNASALTTDVLFAALGGTPQAGGTWSPALSGAGEYTYTVTSLCAGSASSTVTVTDTNLVASSGAGTITCNGGTTTVTVSATGGTAPYTGTGTFTVGAGAYSYTVTDATGCTSTTTGTVVSIPDTTPPTIYFQPSALVPGATGVSTTQSPYLLSQSIGGKFTSILSVNDQVGSYRMVGIPDGLGAYDNNNGTFTLLMNHEIGNTQGITRAHGSTGAFVSKWVINKSNLAVQSGSDLIQTVYTWNTGSSSFVQGTTQFNRFCSADLPPVAGFYNQATGLGTQERIFVTGEESGPEGRAFGHIVTGTNAGVSYQLPYLGRFSWENVVASTASGDKTVVAGTDDSTVNGQVYFYIGTKTNTGTDIDKAGLNNGKLWGVKVSGLSDEFSASTPTPNTPFTLEDLGFVQNTTGATLNSNSVTAGVTNFLRPEDGSFDPSNPNDFYFVTTNSFTAPSRLWRLRFNDITNPETGGTITAVLDGTEGQRMLDNMTIDKFGHVLLQEDPGGQAHTAKVWQYTIATDALELVGKHDPARFGDLVGTVTTPATSPFNNDEESSGIIDMSDILGPGMFLLDVQAHYTSGLANLTEVVQGGQLLAFFNPASMGATASTAAPQTITSCTGTGIDLGTPATADNCSVASVSNDAPTTFPVGTTTVTWTVTDSNGNSSTATQTVIVSDLVASSNAGTITCNGGTTTVVVSATGGTAPYTGTGTFTVSAGDYSYTITDANGCTSIVSGTISEPAQLTTTTTINQVLPYTWSLNGVTYSVTGVYTFNTIDGNGCTVINTLNLTIGTNIAPTQCGSTLSTINQQIYANLVPNAQAYRFRVTDLTTNQVQTIDKALRVFSLNQLASFNFARTYSVEVAARVGGVWQAYGVSCNVTTPSATTQVQASQCGSMLTSVGTVIYANNVSFANGYRFRITNLLSSSSVEVDRFTRDVRLNNISGFAVEEGTTYSIEVAVINRDGSYLPYGTICNVTTPGGNLRADATVVNFKAIAYPNPFNDTFMLDVTTTSQEFIQVRIYDMVGKLIEDKKVEVDSITNLELGFAYPSGIYNVIVSQGDAIQTLRVIKR